jgi:predicted S18 family serine protease
MSVLRKAFVTSLAVLVLGLYAITGFAPAADAMGGTYRTECEATIISVTSSGIGVLVACETTYHDDEPGVDPQVVDQWVNYFQM